MNGASFGILIPIAFNCFVFRLKLIAVTAMIHCARMATLPRCCIAELHGVAAEL